MIRSGRPVGRRLRGRGERVDEGMVAVKRGGNKSGVKSGGRTTAMNGHNDAGKTKKIRVVETIMACIK